MNGFVRRVGACMAASVFGAVGLLILMGCVAQPTNNLGAAGDDINFSTSNVASDGSGAPSTGLQVDLQVFAAKGQNPVRLDYTVTNVYQDLPILAPIYIQYFSGDHIRILDAVPVSGTVIAKGLKSGESVTGTMSVQIESMDWQEAVGPSVTTLLGDANRFKFDGPEETEARNKGGTAFALGSTTVVFRTKESQIEVSRFGWRESEKPGYTTFDDGTRVINPTFDPNVRPPDVTPDIQPTPTKKAMASLMAKS